MIGKIEAQPTPRQERAAQIRDLQGRLSAIREGKMPFEGREDILNRVRALNAEQAASNRRRVSAVS